LLLYLEKLKNCIKVFEKSTSYDKETIDFIVGFVLNDFGFRGVSSVQSAKHGGSAHLINFDGSDTVIASKMIRDVYNTDTIFGKSTQLLNILL
jgi:nicotinic acid phosphoribosyltransferase